MPDYHAQLEANERLHEQGKITYNELVSRNSAIMDKMQARCNHSNTEKEYRPDGYLEWCANDDCGTLVRDTTGGGSGMRVGKTKKKSGCLSALVVLAGTASVAVWGAVEAVKSIL